MTLSRKTIWMLSSIAGLLMAGCTLGGAQMLAARDIAERARTQQQTVAHTLEKLAALDSRPERASIDPQQSDRLAQHIESIASQVGIEPSQIEHMQSQAPRRIEGGPYLRQSTQVLVSHVTLAALVALLNDLDPAGQTLQIDDLRLIADQLVAHAWRAEFTVSYLVYDPIPAR